MAEATLSELSNAEVRPKDGLYRCYDHFCDCPLVLVSYDGAEENFIRCYNSECEHRSKM